MVIIKRIVSYKKSFTLVELLIVIAIISLLIGALIPSLDRSLSSSRLSGDVEVLRSKIEETRLLAASTTISDETVSEEDPGTDRAGYYGIYIPPSDVITGFPPQFYAIVRLSKPFTHYRSAGNGYCSGSQAVNDAIVSTGGPCLVERINLSKGVKFNNASQYNIEHKLIVFEVPTQQIDEIYCPRPCGGERQGSEDVNVYVLSPNPDFKQHTRPFSDTYFQLSHKSKIATIKLEPYTGKLIVSYNQ